MTESLPQEEEEKKQGESGLGGNEVERKLTIIMSLFTQGATTSESHLFCICLKIGNAVFMTSCHCTLNIVGVAFLLPHSYTCWEEFQIFVSN